MSDDLDRAFSMVPRSEFLPPDQRKYADLDVPLPIGFAVTNSQPTTVRDMLRLLAVQPGDSILDVGSGSGWTTALLSHLTGPDGKVTAVERIPELVERSRKALGGLENVSLYSAVPGQIGWPSRAPYDRILVSAAAASLPNMLVEQLTPGGIMVIPVGGTMLRVRRRQDGTPLISRHGAYAFVPLVE